MVTAFCAPICMRAILHETPALDVEGSPLSTPPAARARPCSRPPRPRETPRGAGPGIAMQGRMALTFTGVSLALLGLPLSYTPTLDAPAPAPAPESAPALADKPDATDAGTFSYRRAALELAGVMAAGAAWYEVEIDFNRQDFDFDRTWSSQWQRLALGRGYRLDDNDRSTNIA